MKIAVLGATGKTGAHLVQQARAAGHDVVTYVRRPEAIPAQAGVTVVGGQAKASLPARLVYRTAMAAIFGDKEKAETLLPSSGLNWAALYPVMLHEAPPLAQVNVKPLESVTHVPGLPKVTFANAATVLLELATHPDRPGQRFLLTA